MNTYDLSPLFRSTVGFDHLSQLIDSAFKVDERVVNYPPYNIAKLSEDEYDDLDCLMKFAPSFSFIFKNTGS